MFVLVHHDVKREEEFPQYLDRLYDHPKHLHLAQLVPAKSMSTAVSLWVAPSVDAVRDHVDNVLEGQSVQEYHEVDEKIASGLERTRVQGAGNSSAA